MRKTPSEIAKQHKFQLYALCGIFAFLIFIVFAINNILVSILLAIVSSYVLKPAVQFLERRGLDRNTAIIIPFSASVFVFVMFFVWLGPVLATQIGILKYEMPKYIELSKLLFQNTEQQISVMSFQLVKLELGIQITQYFQEQASIFFQNLPSIISNLLTILLLVPILTFFFLRDSSTVRSHFYRFVPNNIFELFINISAQVDKQLGEFLRARVLESFIVGAIVWLGLVLIGFPYAGLLALFASICNLIPYIGPIIAIIPALALCFVNQESGFITAMVLSVYAIAQIIDIFVIIPGVVAKLVNLHPVTVILAIIIGSELKGVLGMLISIPLASMIKLVFTSFYQHFSQQEH